jgi:hypothetical protein
MGMFARVVSSTLLRTAVGGGGGGGSNSSGDDRNGDQCRPDVLHTDGQALIHDTTHLSSLYNDSSLDTPSPDHDDRRSPSLHGNGSGVANGAAADEGRKGRGERRVMPARLRRISSLLAGSIEEEVANAAAKEVMGSSILGSTALLLTTNENVQCQKFPLQTAEAVDMTQGLRREQIQTPEFRTRDDTEVMGKTRSMRSEEDTSDAAFERRHRKADNMEKRLRKWEKENLVKERQKVVDRIELLRSANVHVFEPILQARQKTGEEEKSEDVAQIGSDDTHLHTLERLRDDLVEQHRIVLRRYDALLAVPLEENASSSVIGKRKAGANSTATQDANGKPRRVISFSGAFARKSTANAATASTIKPSSSMSALTDEQPKKPNTKYVKAHRLSLEEKGSRPFLDADGKIRAENTYANIHARTNGGRFAPKSALGGAAPSGPRSKVNTKTGRPKSQQGLPRSARRAASSSSSTTTTSATPKLEDGEATHVAQVPLKRGPGRPRKDGTVTARRASNGEPSARRPGRSAQPQSAGNESESEGVTQGTPRTRRVKLTFNRNKGENSGDNSHDSAMLKPKRETEDVMMHDQADVSPSKREETDSEDETDAALSTSTTPARAALTLEQAQALFAQALADGDEDAKDEADAAAYVIPPSS